MIQVFVPGAPVPQGSKSAYNRGGRIVLVEANKKLPAWRKHVKETLEAASASCEPMTGPVTLEVMFFMPKAKSNRDEYPIGRVGDLDKLIRSINDAATDAGIFNDDSQVIEIVAHKVWDGPDLPTGALITFSKFVGVSYSD